MGWDPMMCFFVSEMWRGWVLGPLMQTQKAAMFHSIPEPILGKLHLAFLDNSQYTTGGITHKKIQEMNIA